MTINNLTRATNLKAFIMSLTSGITRIFRNDLL